MIRKLFAVACLLIATLWSGPTWAGVMLDQSHDAVAAGRPSNVSVSRTTRSAQTFTVGLAGLLSQVDLQIVARVPSEDLNVSVHSTNGNSIGTILGTVIIDSSLVPEVSASTYGNFVSVDLSGLGIVVTPGEVLAVGLSYPTSGTGGYSWWNNFTPGYQGGDMYQATQVAGWAYNRFAGFDAGFRTYVDTGAAGTVPEPCSFAIFALTGVAPVLSRRRKKA